MVEFSTMGITAMIMLVFINVFMLYTLQMPGGQDGQALDLGIDGQQQLDLNANTTSFLSQTSTIGSSITNWLNKLKIDTQQQNYLTLFSDMLFGGVSAAIGTAGEALGLAGTLIAALLNIFFGYAIWIDYLLPPSTQLVIFGWAFKGFFFWITLYGLYVIVSSMFGLGTGAKV